MAERICVGCWIERQVDAERVVIGLVGEGGRGIRMELSLACGQDPWPPFSRRARVVYGWK